MFGTSGVRGIVGQDVTCELAFKIGAAFGGMFGEIVIARDTRPHGRMLESALISGILFSGHYYAHYLVFITNRKRTNVNYSMMHSF